jgi:hypothetical protein
MAEDLIRARERGVNVTVLIEGGPVGGISAEGRAVAGALNRSGIPVLSMTTTDAAHAKYRFDHANTWSSMGIPSCSGARTSNPTATRNRGCEGTGAGV